MPVFLWPLPWKKVQANNFQKNPNACHNKGKSCKLPRYSMVFIFKKKSKWQVADSKRINQVSDLLTQSHCYCFTNDAKSWSNKQEISVTMLSSGIIHSCNFLNATTINWPLASFLHQLRSDENSDELKHAHASSRAEKCRGAKETGESSQSLQPQMHFEFKLLIWMVQLQVETMVMALAKNTMGLK